MKEILKDDAEEKEMEEGEEEIEEEETISTQEEHALGNPLSAVEERDDDDDDKTNPNSNAQVGATATTRVSNKSLPEVFHDQGSLHHRRNEIFLPLPETQSPLPFRGAQREQPEDRLGPSRKSFAGPRGVLRSVSSMAPRPTALRRREQAWNAVVRFLGEDTAATILTKDDGPDDTDVENPTASPLAIIGTEDSIKDHAATTTTTLCVIKESILGGQSDTDIAPQ